MRFGIDTSGLVQLVSFLLVCLSLAVPAKGQEARSGPSQLDLIRKLWVVPVRQASDPSKQLSSCRLHTSGDLLIIEDSEGVRALNLHTGVAAWGRGGEEVDPGDLVRSEPSLARSEVSGTLMGSLWVGWIDRGLLALDLNAEGQVLWFRRIEELADSELIRFRPHGPPVRTGDAILAPLIAESSHSSVKLVCVSVQGEIVWRREVMISIPKRIRPPSSTLFYDEDKKAIYWIPGGARLLALEEETGTIQWETELVPDETESQFGRGIPSISLSGDSLFVTTGTTLNRVRRSNGEIIWRHDFLIPSGTICGDIDGLVILAGGWLTGVSRDSGLIRWRAGNRHRKIEFPCATTWYQDILVSAIDGELWGIDPKSGGVTLRTPVPGLPKDTDSILIPADDILIITSPRQIIAYQIHFR